MRIPTKTKVLRNRKDSSPSTTTTSSSGGEEGGGGVEEDSSHHLLPLPPHHKMRASPSSTSNSSSLSSSPSSTSTGQGSCTSSSTPISLLREDLVLEQEFNILKTLSQGTFSNSSSKIILASLKKDPLRSKVVIKAIDSSLTSVPDFNREVELTYLLSPHPNVVTCYNVSWLWNGAICFLQEWAPYGSLSRLLTNRRRESTSSSRLGLGERATKMICSQVGSALEFIHHLRLVHGSVTPNHVLLFKGDCSLVKLTDFSSTRSEGSLVRVKDSSPPTCFTPPELSGLLPQEKFHMRREQDAWALGVLMGYLLEGGRVPWATPDPLQDPSYRGYVAWLKRKNLKVPHPLRNTTPRFIRLFKRLCEPKVGQRCGVRELRKYLKDLWLIKGTAPRHERSGSKSMWTSAAAPVIRKISEASTGSTVDCCEAEEVNQKSQNLRSSGQLDSDQGAVGEPLSLLSSEIDKERKLEDWVKRSCKIRTKTNGTFTINVEQL